MSNQVMPSQRPPLSERLRSFSLSPYCVPGAFLWGLCEGVFFFIVPDMLTTFIGLFRLRTALIAMIASIVGSLLSAVALYLLVTSLGELTMVNFVRSIPFISDQMVSEASAQLTNYGFAALVQAPWKGLPYKIYSVLAPVQGLSLASYLLWSIPSRLERLLPTTLLAGVLGITFSESIRKRTLMWLGIYLVIWLLVYTFYWTNILL